MSAFPIRPESIIESPDYGLEESPVYALDNDGTEFIGLSMQLCSAGQGLYMIGGIDGADCTATFPFNQPEAAFRGIQIVSTQAVPGFPPLGGTNDIPLGAQVYVAPPLVLTGIVATGWNAETFMLDLQGNFGGGDQYSGSARGFAVYPSSANVWAPLSGSPVFYTPPGGCAVGVVPQQLTGVISFHNIEGSNLSAPTSILAINPFQEGNTQDLPWGMAMVVPMVNFNGSLGDGNGFQLVPGPSPTTINTDNDQVPPVLSNYPVSYNYASATQVVVLWPFQTASQIPSVPFNPTTERLVVII